MTYYAIVYGDPVSGFGVLGPFPSTVSADHYAFKHFKSDYWIVLMEKPLP